VKQQGLSQAGLRLWQVEPPLRIRDRVSGIQVNGDAFAGAPARLDAYGCTDGTFSVTLIVKGPQTIVITVDGKEVKRLGFPAPKPEESWHGEFPVSGHARDLCTLEVTPTGLMGTTVFAFDRG
jgi:hypothetical protein